MRERNTHLCLLLCASGPRTHMGQGQPLVYILGPAFKIVTLHLAPFNRDSIYNIHLETVQCSALGLHNLVGPTKV